MRRQGQREQPANDYVGERHKPQAASTVGPPDATVLPPYGTSRTAFVHAHAFTLCGSGSCVLVTLGASSREGPGGGTSWPAKQHKTKDWKEVV
jgi:hypothetical protein